MTRNLVNEIAQGLREAYECDPTGWTREDLTAEVKRTNEGKGFTVYSAGSQEHVLRTEHIHLTEDELRQVVRRTCRLLEQEETA